MGHPRRDGTLYNAASLYGQGRLVARYFKQDLPNYGVFDEKRYFSAGTETCVVSLPWSPAGAAYLRRSVATGPGTRGKGSRGS